MQFFQVDNVAFSIWGYAISYIELLGTAFGFISVYLASRTSILTWPTGLVNEVFLFILFYQVQLYPDMFLQVYFFIITIYGWYNWRRNHNETKVTVLTVNNKVITGIAIAICTAGAGFMFSNIHQYLSRYFPQPAAYPYTDSFVMVASIAATALLARKKADSWYLWVIIDLVCIFLYFKRGVYFLSLEYFIFLGMALYGLYNWQKQLRHG